MQFNGYRRPDDSVGIRNRLLVIAVDECCEGVARQIAAPFQPDAVVLTNWYTCMLGGNEATFHQMAAVAENPNVAGVLVLAMGCGSIVPRQLADPVAGRTGKPVATLTVEDEGGTRRAIARGRAILEELAGRVHGQKPEPFPVDRLVVGVKCGGSDTSSGMASNPACGAAVDRLIDLGATCIGGELFELQGCEDTLAARAVSPGVGDRIRQLIDDERARWCVEGVEVETMSVGNYVGGLTTIEEKSLGALHKIGSRPIRDILEITERGVDRPGPPGLYLSEATMLCGGAGVNFAAMGAHMLLWTTGSAGFESPLTPVLRISGNRQIMTDDIDIDASGIMDGTRGVSQVAEDILRALLETAGGRKTAIEDLGGSSLTLYQKKA